jgi:hypothetical protein
MIETDVLISTAIRSYNWLRVWHEKQANPPHIPDNAIVVFKRFKEAYDDKNIGKLSSTISDSFRGDLYGVRTKQEFIDIQMRVFNRLPWGVNPCLSINVYSMWRMSAMYSLQSLIHIQLLQCLEFHLETMILLLFVARYVQKTDYGL